MQYVYRVLLGKPEGKSPLGRHRRRWEDNSNLELQKVRCGFVNWFELAQDTDSWWAHVTGVMNIRVP